MTDRAMYLSRVLQISAKLPICVFPRCSSDFKLAPVHCGVDTGGVRVMYTVFLKIRPLADTITIHASCTYYSCYTSFPV